jgi:hypothetical protein
MTAQTTQTNTSSDAIPGDLSSVDILAETTGKGSKKISSFFDLIDSAVEQPSTEKDGKPIVYTSPLSGSDSSTLAMLFGMLFDKAALNADPEVLGRININTAPEGVLRALPGLTPEQVDMILSARPDFASGDGVAEIYQSPAWLISEAGIPASTVKSLEKYITTKTQVYRLQTTGYFEGGGPMVRLEAVIDVNAGLPRILYYRNLSELGKAINTGGQ